MSDKAWTVDIDDGASVRTVGTFRDEAAAQDWIGEWVHPVERATPKLRSLSEDGLTEGGLWGGLHRFQQGLPERVEDPDAIEDICRVLREWVAAEALKAEGEGLP